MSLINKMLQDLDKRHAADGGGKALPPQLRPVAARKDWSRVMWEIGAGLVIGAGWSVWVLYQISPRSVVTELAFQSQAKKPHQAAAGLQAPEGSQVQPPPVASAAALPNPAVPPAAPLGAGAPVPPAAAPAVATAASMPVPQLSPGGEAIKVDMLRLATEITTPFNEKSFGVKPGTERKSQGGSAQEVKAAGKVKPAAPALAALEAQASSPAEKPGTAAPAAKAQGPASIDKQMRVAMPAERAEMQFRNATALLNQGRVAEAIDGYKTTLLLDSGHLAARQALVGLLLENKRVDEAQQFLQEGLNLSPERSNYAMLLARIQVERGDLQGAHELLDRHAAGAANSADYHAFDAAVLQRLGRHKEAVAGYQAALRLAPRAGLWWMGLGISLQADNRGAEALDAFRRARSAGGISPELLSFVDQRVKQLQ
jgi:MSHA biogenesis protein MshN